MYYFRLELLFYAFTFHKIIIYLLKFKEVLFFYYFQAMTTGSISNFIDVALNFGSSAVTEDSVINQAKYNKRTLVFYGDDTWLRLFPNSFMRSDGTTSFYVSDFTEVLNFLYLSGNFCKTT